MTEDIFMFVTLLLSSSLYLSSWLYTKWKEAERRAFHEKVGHLDTQIALLRCDILLARTTNLCEMNRLDIPAELQGDLVSWANNRSAVVRAAEQAEARLE